MTRATTDIAAMVFRPAPPDKAPAVSLDRLALAVLLALDGRRSLAEVARELAIGLETAAEAARRLLAQGLAHPVSHAPPVVDAATLQALTALLARAVGPYAVVLVEEEIQRLGYRPGRFPTVRLPQLVRRLAESIRREDQRREFLAASGRIVRRAAAGSAEDVRREA